MDKQKITDQLIIDENLKLVVYLDTEGYETVGVGHLIMKKDNLKLGDSVSFEKCKEFLDKDLNNSIFECERYIKDFYGHPEEIQNELVNLMFNMGLTTFSKFRKFFYHLDNKEYNDAADELFNSLWSKQVGIRAIRIIKIFKDRGNYYDNLADKVAQITN